MKLRSAANARQERYTFLSLLIFSVFIALGSIGCTEESPSDTTTSGEEGGTSPSLDALETGDTAKQNPADTNTNQEDSALQDGLSPNDADTQDTQEPTEPTYCEQKGYPEKEFLAGTGSDYGKVAGFFTAETLAGPWTITEHWTGCDTYVFVNYTNNTNFWNSSVSELLNRSPDNVHYFFSSYETGDAAFNRVVELKGRLDAALTELPPSVSQSWAGRLHYVTTSAKDIGGSVGAFLSKKTVPALGIDRNQVFQHGGSLAVFMGGFVDQLSAVPWLPRYYNYMENTQALLAEDQNDVLEVALFADTEVTLNNETYTAEFPSAEEMDGFDTMVADLQITCGPEPGNCGEWDYEAYIQLCTDDTCSEIHEILVWITPYSRPGLKHWVIDMTPFLGLVRDGGVKTFRFGMLWNMNPNTLNLNFRLSNRGIGHASKTVTPLFTGGDFNASYNDKYSPITVSVPENTKKTEIVVIVSGHGQEAGNNCAEWCNHQHEFSVDGTHTFLKDHSGEAGTPTGCAERVDDGVVPGQYGNWAPGRAAWCPGLPVHPWIVDITEHMSPGSDHEISYQGLFNGGNPAGGRIRLNSFLVFYE